MTICNIIFVTPLFLNTVWVLENPEDNWTQGTRIAAPFILGLIIVICATNLGTGLGYPRARNAMIAILSVLTGLAIWDTVARISTWWPLVHDIGRLSAWEWWLSAVGVRWSAWLALNIWYFFGRRRLPRQHEITDAPAG